MNEVGRCTQTALALGVVQRLAPGRRLALIDVGTGSGLGLGLDRYHVDLGGDRSFGPPDSPVQLTCAVDGTPPLPPGRPPIDWRLGIDIAPIDLADVDSQAWLTACTPPTADAEPRLAGAIALTRDAAIEVRAGDGVAPPRPRHRRSAGRRPRRRARQLHGSSSTTPDGRRCGRPSTRPAATS